MYDFLATATDRNGTRSTHHVVATSTIDAVAKLKADGCTDIELHTDDAGAASARMTGLKPGMVTPKDMVELRSLSTFAYFLFNLKKHVRSVGITLVGALAIVAWSTFRGDQLGFLFWIAITLIVLPVFIAFYITFFTPSRKYDKLIYAWTWGRWESVLTLVPQLRGHVAELELDAREAVALAKMGHVEDGLSKIEQHSTNAEVPRWLFLSRLAEFYECIEMHDLAIDCHRQAYEDSPDNPTIELDYAMSLLRNETNIPKADQLVASAKEKPLTDMLQMMMPHVHGLQELNNKNYARAKSSFDEARKKLAPMAAQPVVRLILDINSAYLAIASAKNGDFETAKQHYRPAKKRLEAFRAEKLLSRLNKAVSTSA